MVDPSLDWRQSTISFLPSFKTQAINYNRLQHQSGKNDIVACLQSSLGFAMYYLCCDQGQAKPTRMTGMYKLRDWF